MERFTVSKPILLSLFTQDEEIGSLILYSTIWRFEQWDANGDLELLSLVEQRKTFHSSDIVL